jgi:hypothetical protein
MSDIEILKQFRKSLISFLDELIGQFPSEGDLIMFRIFLKDRIPIVNIMNFYVLKILPFEKLVKERNEDFFLNHCSLLDNMNMDKQSKVYKFKKLWRSNTLDEDDRQIIWKWFDSFMFMARKYQESFTKQK